MPPNLKMVLQRVKPPDVPHHESRGVWLNVKADRTCLQPDGVLINQFQQEGNLDKLV